MKILIFGGCGFLGSNLAAHGIQNGDDITVFDNLSRVGSSLNLAWLKTIGDFKFIHGDTSNREIVDKTVAEGQFNAIFQLAGQVAMTTSIADPFLDFSTNALGTFNVLNAIRKYSLQTSMIFSSTNKVYGDLEYLTYEETDTRYICKEYPKGFDESVGLDFHSPYGCSKGAADQYMLDFHRIYGAKTIVFRHSSMYGGRQFATSDQGWIGWFCRQALEKKKNPDSPAFDIHGNGKQVRDILHADDMIRLYYEAAKNADKISGQVFNIGGGIDQSLSLLELFKVLEDMVGVKLEYVMNAPRISDQKFFVANNEKITKAIGWEPKVTASEGIGRMIKWMEELV